MITRLSEKYCDCRRIKKKSIFIDFFLEYILALNNLGETYQLNSENENARRVFKTVLDLDPKALPMPRIPNPFSPFLEKEPKSRLEALELKRNRIQHMINMLQGELETVDEGLAALSKKKQNLDNDSLSVGEQEKKEAY